MSEPFPPPGFVPTPSLVPGIEVFKPADTVEEGTPVVEFACPQCGATTAYSVAQGGLTCTHCGYYEPPAKPVVGKGAEEFEFKAETLERAAHGWGDLRCDQECQNCGALTSLPADQMATTCPFCGSNQVIQRPSSQEQLRPRFIIPFQIDSDTCQSTLRQWLGSSWMTPAALRQLANVQHPTAIYLPFWTFDALAGADWRAEVGHTKTVRYRAGGEWRTRTTTEWRWESGHADEMFDDLVVPGTARLSRLLLGRVDNFDLRQLAPYEAKYLAGLQAQAYDVTLEQAWEEARSQMREQTRLECRGQASTSQIRNFSMTLDFSNESWRYVLLPVYLAPYRYADQAYQVIINGQTGTIAGQRPVDWNKVWLVAGAVVSPGALLSLIGLLATPLIGPLLAALGVGSLVIGLIVGLVIILKARGLDDV